MQTVESMIAPASEGDIFVAQSSREVPHELHQSRERMLRILDDVLQARGMDVEEMREADQLRSLRKIVIGHVNRVFSGITAYGPVPKEYEKEAADHARHVLSDEHFRALALHAVDAILSDARESVMTEVS